jgi:PAS domain S-box-containing protein
MRGAGSSTRPQKADTEYAKAEITKLYAQLEQRVEERTRALEAANEELRREIARRERVEEDLRQQKEILQTIFDHIPVMISFIDQNGQIKLVNREWERTLGRSFKEIQGQDVEIVVEEYFPDPEDREQVLDFVRNSDAQWADFKTSIRDGRVIDMSWSMLRLSEGTRIGIGQDITRRKCVEEALRESEERFRQLAENIHDLFWIKTPDYKRVLYLSPIYERISGSSREERYRDQDFQPFLDRIFPEDRERMAEIMRSEAGAEFDIEFRIMRPDGSVGWIRDRGFPIRDQSGQVYRVAGIAQDITERKLAEEALRESEERFRQLTENIREVFWLRSPDLRRLLYVSPMYEKVCGRSRESLYAEGGADLMAVHPEDRSRVIETMRNHEGRDFEIEYRILTKDGDVRWIRDRGFPIRDQSGQICRIAGVADDITESKLVENALRESEERFRQIAENIREVFWLRSPDLKQLLYVSPMYERVYGWTRESLYAAGPERVVHPEDRHRVMETVKSIAGNEFEIEYRIITKDGQVRWIRDRGFPVRDEFGAVCRIGGVAEDITDRKEAADRLRASSEQLRALSASLQSAREKEATRIARQIHDELGGILTGLRWELEAFDKTIHQAGDAGQLKVMRAKLASMVGLTDITIDVVRHIASELRPSILDDLGLLEAIEWQTQQFQARTGIRCRCDCALQSIPLGDQQSTAVFRIVQEALTNILRHAQATRAGVAMKEEDGVLILTVTDNGRGITPAETLSRESLGLLGMQERAHLIGGSIEIVGQKGTGTTLHVRIPLGGREPGGAT